MVKEKNFELLKEEMDNIGLKYSVEENEEYYGIKSGINLEDLKVPFFITVDNTDVSLIAELPIKVNEQTLESSLRNVNKINSENLKYGKYELDLEDNTIYFTNYIYSKNIELPVESIRNILMAGIYALSKYAIELQKDLL